MNVKNVPYHMSEKFRIAYVLSGKITLNWVSGKQEVVADGIEIINVDEPVAITSMQENIVAIFEINMDFAKRYCKDIDVVTYNCNCNFFFPSNAKDEDQIKLKKILNQIYDIYIVPNLYYEMPVSVMNCMQLIKEKFNDVKNLFPDSDGTTLHAERFLRINDYILNNLHERISLKNIAEKEYLSEQYISKEFSLRLNRNFQAIIDYYRVKKAVKMLIATDCPVSVISDQCGFSDKRYFYTNFKKYLKCNPSDFRKDAGERIPDLDTFLPSSSIAKRYFNHGDGNLVEGSTTTVYCDCLDKEAINNSFVVKNIEHMNSLFSRQNQCLNGKKITPPKLVESVFDLVKEMMTNNNFIEWMEEQLKGDSKNDWFPCDWTRTLVLSLKGYIVSVGNRYVVIHDADIIKILILNETEREMKYSICFQEFFAKEI